jgi:putative ABC transport system permease protein
MAFHSIQAQKVRSSLTLLGVVIGVSSVIGVAAIIEGLNRGVIGRIQALGSKVFILSRLPAGTFGRPREDIRLRKHFRFSDARRIEESSPSAEYVSAFTTRAAFFGDSNNVRYRNEQVTNLILRGVDHNYSAAIPMFDVSEGRTISRYDQDHARAVAVIGQGIAATLFPQVDPIGKTIRLNGLPFDVVGVFFKDEGLFGGPGVDQFVCIPYGTFHKLYPEIEEHFLAVSVRDTADLPKAADEVISAARRVRKVPPAAENDFDLMLPEYFARLWRQLTGALFILTFSISSIALLVGGIGVMNVMLVSVTQRTHEIGIRKAVGARRQDIRTQFLIEALALTSAGGVLGVLLGGGLAWLISAIYPMLPIFVSPFWVLAGLSLAAGVGLFFGYYPASKAAQLDPIVCLRYE